MPKNVMPRIATLQVNPLNRIRDPAAILLLTISVSLSAPSTSRMPEAPAAFNDFCPIASSVESAFQVSETRSLFRKFAPSYVLRLWRRVSHMTGRTVPHDGTHN